MRERSIVQSTRPPREYMRDISRTEGAAGGYGKRGAGAIANSMRFTPAAARYWKATTPERPRGELNALWPRTAWPPSPESGQNVKNVTASGGLSRLRRCAGDALPLVTIVVVIGATFCALRLGNQRRRRMTGQRTHRSDLHGKVLSLTAYGESAALGTLHGEADRNLNAAFLFSAATLRRRPPSISLGSKR